MNRCAVLLSALVVAAAPALAQDAKPESEKDKVSYSVGYQMGSDFKRQGQDINPEMVVRGAQDALAGTAPVLSEEEMRSTLVALKQRIVATQQEERERISRESAAAGKAFLAENAKKEGVVSLPSGLQYKVLSEGSGESPKENDNVTVHYRGTLVDGTEFDSSYKRGEPATFPLNGVIAGWTEGLQLMNTGAKYEFFIPSNLAYGERGSRGAIPPNATLTFEVELLDVK